MRLCSKSITFEDQIIARKGLLDDPRYGVEVLLLDHDRHDPDTTFEVLAKHSDAFACMPLELPDFWKVKGERVTQPMHPFPHSPVWRSGTKEAIRQYITLANRLQEATGKVTHLNLQFQFNPWFPTRDETPEQQLDALATYIQELKDLTTIPLVLENTIPLGITVSSFDGEDTPTFRYHHNQITSRPRDAKSLGMGLVFDPAHYAQSIKRWYDMTNDRFTSVDDDQVRLTVGDYERALLSTFGEDYQADVQSACNDVLSLQKPVAIHLTNTVSGIDVSPACIENDTALDLEGLTHTYINTVDNPMIIAEHGEEDYTNPVNQQAALRRLAEEY